MANIELSKKDAELITDCMDYVRIFLEWTDIDRPEEIPSNITLEEMDEVRSRIVKEIIQPKKHLE